jgi:hypothetical protein
MLALERAYRYFLLDEIPTEAELDGMGFDEVHPKPIVALEVDPPELPPGSLPRALRLTTAIP